jgi:SAM-dependent methyltransferase
MKDLHDKESSIEFYDARYEEGYMEEWDEGKKSKVKELIKDLPLPQKGRALDFGCGNGVFTNILKECLPDWEVNGVEISKTAVANASRKYPNCNFFIADGGSKYLNQFDFLFSHHVIEHVPDLRETFETINSYLKPQAYQLHILPCGNEGSLEYKICQLKKGGIEKNKENRFFFEEPGHLRRLNTKEFEECERRIGFHLEKDFYANQYHGAINWITKSSPRFVKKLTSTDDAIDQNAKKELQLLRKKLLPLTYYQFPYSKYWAIKSKWKKSLADRIKLFVLFAPGLFSKKIFDKIEKAATDEWRRSKAEKNGSEMFLFFKR